MQRVAACARACSRTAIPELQGQLQTPAVSTPLCAAMCGLPPPPRLDPLQAVDDEDNQGGSCASHEPKPEAVPAEAHPMAQHLSA